MSSGDDEYDDIDVGEELSQPYPAISDDGNVAWKGDLINILHYIPKEEK